MHASTVLQLLVVVKSVTQAVNSNYYSIVHASPMQPGMIFVCSCLVLGDGCSQFALCLEPDACRLLHTPVQPS